MSSVTLSPLGKASTYVSQYDPSLLFPIPRQKHRDEIGVVTTLPFKGVDVWNAYELSWLNSKGKPVVALAEFIFPCESSHLIESKSFKLYLNSFNNTKINSLDDMKAMLKKDLSAACGAEVIVNVIPVDAMKLESLQAFSGTCLDHLDIECDTYLINANYLQTENQKVTETVFSNLLKSNCLVTGQPDWATIQIRYTGNKIQHEGLLKYLVSFRNHNEFHEQCVERIFVDILRHCKPQHLTVEARYTRRGGLDINPFRSTDVMATPNNVRLVRQ